MNKKTLGVGIVLGMVIGGASIGYATNQYVQALLNQEIKVSLNGQIQEFKDVATGEVMYPLTYKDRTYLPLRNVAELSGLDVDYDANSKTAILNKDMSKNTLSKEEMESKLLNVVYGYTGAYGSTDIIQDGNYKGEKASKMLIDIDSDGVPEILNIVSAPHIGISSIYTIRNDEVFELSHEAGVIDYFLNLYQTENGVYVYYGYDDGPIVDRVIYKLSIQNSEVIRQEILRKENKNYIDIETGESNGYTYYIKGEIVSKEKFVQEIENLNKINLIERKDLSIDYSTNKPYQFENLWSD